ncbi:MAG: hypothetical protein AB7O97_16725 [Planctomycetota bacterium]
MCQKPTLAALLLAACAAPTPPPVPVDWQPPIGAAYLPADYHGELFVDWAAMRDLGLLDRLERLPMAPQMLEVIASHRGGDIDAVARMRTAWVPTEARGVTITELVAGAEPAAAATDLRIGPFAGERWAHTDTAPVSIRPAPDLIVDGPPKLLTDLVTGRSPTGGPHAELVPMLSGSGVLAQIAYGRFGSRYDTLLHTFGALFGAEDDPVDFVRLRLRHDDDGALHAEARARFARGERGLADAAALVRERLDTARADPRFAAFRPQLDAVRVVTEGADLAVALPLGSPREAVGTVERLGLLLFAQMRAGR